MDNKKKEKSEGEKLAEKLLSDKKTVDFALKKSSKRQTSSARAIKAF